MPRIPQSIPWPAHLALAALLVAFPPTHALAAGKQTVCTITVNSSNEKEAFRRHLPADQFEFVELVERGRPDWLESARQKGIRCDVLVISGHYDGGDYAGGNEFFSEHVDSREYLPVDEMERVACSEPANGLFSRLKAVYLFGCNTLNPEALRSVPEEIARSLVQSGHPATEAERLSHEISARYADSSRDRMRQIFKDVPAIYGFSSVAPLGPTAAAFIDRYLQAGGAREIASGHPTSRILGYFPGHSFTLTRGSTNADPDARFRSDMCQFLDDRLSGVQRAEFVHRLLGRDMAEVRFFLDRLERYAASLTEESRDVPDIARALDGIAHDKPARARYLQFMREADDSRLHVRMIGVAERLGWLSPDEKHAELGRLIADKFARTRLTVADVNFVCTLDAGHAFDSIRHDLQLTTRTEDVGHAAILACLGGPEDRARLLQALTSSNDADVQIAQVYLRHHPIADVNELRDVATGIARMGDANGQVRALDTLADHRLSDPETLEELADLFPVAKSINVQRAIAGVLIRSDYKAMARPELVRRLREHRLKSPDGRDLIDVLINRLQAAS